MYSCNHIKITVLFVEENVCKVHIYFCQGRYSITDASAGYWLGMLENLKMVHAGIPKWNVYILHSLMVLVCRVLILVVDKNNELVLLVASMPEQPWCCWYDYIYQRTSLVLEMEFSSLFVNTMPTGAVGP